MTSQEGTANFRADMQGDHAGYAVQFGRSAASTSWLWRSIWRWMSAGGPTINAFSAGASAASGYHQSVSKLPKTARTKPNVLSLKCHNRYYLAPAEHLVLAYFAEGRQKRKVEQMRMSSAHMQHFGLDM
jgi:hypothetical protein